MLSLLATHAAVSAALPAAGLLFPPEPRGAVRGKRKAALGKKQRAVMRKFKTS